jgi:hypothetical protein
MPKPKWLTHVIAVVRSPNGELVEDVVHKDVLQSDRPETPHGEILDANPSEDSGVPSPDELQPGTIQRGSSE